MSKLKRREFLRAAATAVGPAIIPATAFGKDAAASPADRLTMGIVGVGGQGGYHMRTLSGYQDVRILAVADVDAERREAAVEHVDNAYAAERKSGTYRGCAQYNDFRELLARPEIDAVLIATPDHWHAAVAVAAMEAGKDCYLEKPIALTVAQGRAVCDVAKRYRRVVQIGSHERSRPTVRFACELVRSGRIGKLHTIRVNMPLDNPKERQIPPQPVMPVPEGLDWNMWLGPAPWSAYTRKRCHFWFRYITDTSGGEMTDRGAHILDIAQLGNGSDDTGPVEVWAQGWRPANSLFDTFMTFDYTFTYANGVQIIGGSEGPRGLKFEGSDGWVFVHIHGGKLEADPPSLLKEELGEGDVLLGRSAGHHQDFLNAVRTRGPTMATPEIGHRTATLCHLTNIAMLTGERLAWDPVAERVTNGEQADRMLSRPPREPWLL